MSSYAPLNSSREQQWPFADNTNTANHMQLIATIAVVVIVILISFHIYVRYRRRNHVLITIHSRSATPPTAAAGGLDAAAIASLPTFVNRVGSPANDCKEECAVCLSAAEEGEMMRLLPACRHVFHIECIDMWLHSHSTCPVCRTRARPMAKSEFGESLVAPPPLPESFGHGGGGRAAQEGGSGSSQASGVGNGSGRWLSTVDDGVADLERQ